jgi:hypothetical protein
MAKESATRAAEALFLILHQKGLKSMHNVKPLMSMRDWSFLYCWCDKCSAQFYCHRIKQLQNIAGPIYLT